MPRRPGLAYGKNLLGGTLKNIDREMQDAANAEIDGNRIPRRADAESVDVAVGQALHHERRRQYDEMHVLVGIDTAGGQTVLMTAHNAKNVLDNLINITQTTTPQVISHYNLFRSAEIDGSAAPGYSSGQAIAAMESLAAKMPQGFSYSWTGLSLEELQAGGTSLILFGLGTLVVYLTLSAQYESFVLPFIVLLAVPMALLGALGAQWIRGLQDDVFCQVGLVMLVGLSSKNAILIVEFSEQLRQRGMPLVEAAVQAATIRLRPILMTSLAFILGVVPLVVATGAGENGRHSVGTTVFGGMIMSTFLNLFFIPVLYLIIEGWREHGKKAAPVAEPLP